MFRNYLKTTLRSLARHKFFSAINIFGLAIGMSVCMCIIMLVADQLTYDRHNSKRDRIYRITTHYADQNGVIIDKQPNAASPMPLRQELLEKYTGVEQVVRIMRGFGNGWLEMENQNVNIPLAGFFADAEALAFFEYELQYGDAATALKEPYSVVLTRQAANKLFKEENPLGQTITVGEIGTYTVTGVLKETENKSHLVFEALASISTVSSSPDTGGSLSWYKGRLTDWTNYWNGWTYILTDAAQSRESVQANLDKIYAQHIGSITNPNTYRMKFGLQNLMSITPGPLTNNPVGPILPWFFIYFLGALALVILLTSCFNFTNLSIARSLTRAREIGIRKVTGAVRWQVFTQFLSEAIMVAFVALALSYMLLLILKPVILQLNFARMFRWDLESNTLVMAAFAAFAILVGVLAGFFPAVVLSGFQPVKVLKNFGNMKLFSRMGLRKTLLVAQFTLSLFFILSALVLYKQFNLFMGQSHGFNMENNIAIKLNNTSAQNLKNELARYNNITHVSATSHVPSAGMSYGTSLKHKLDDPDWINADYFLVDEDYLANMNLQLLAGRFFKAGATETNKDYVVINEQAVTKFNLGTPQDAIGQELIQEHDSLKRTIIGVVAGYHHRDLTQQIIPLTLLYDPTQYNVLQVSYLGTYEQAAASIEKAWATVNPDLKIDYKTVNSEVKKFYEIIFGDLVSVLAVIASLAVLISCLGLLGMATYTLETRIKEISIRKILGSGNGSLIVLLSKGFIVLLLISVAIAVPLAYLANNAWLQLIAYHTTFDASVIVAGVLILILFAIITIGSQAIRATFVNPVENLKE
ncbi:MAG: ABC transporter permease [Cyclobacteriaceae bacterium]|nr:ABC transporter permease [Cyclobacteriaceae bacterium]